jgi:hypothetical protein
MTRTLRIVLVLLLGMAVCLALTVVLSADKCDQDQKLTIEQLPPAVRATLESLAQGNPIEDLEKETEDGVTFYSADIIKGDTKLGVEIAEDGKLLNSETEAIGSEKGEQDIEENEADEENETDADDEVTGDDQSGDDEEEGEDGDDD